MANKGDCVLHDNIQGAYYQYSDNSAHENLFNNKQQLIQHQNSQGTSNTIPPENANSESHQRGDMAATPGLADNGPTDTVMTSNNNHSQLNYINGDNGDNIDYSASARDLEIYYKDVSALKMRALSSSDPLEQRRLAGYLEEAVTYNVYLFWFKAYPLLHSSTHANYI
jgi:hypothetical protein